MTVQNKPRYVTRTISEELSIELQAIVWQFYDEIIEQRKEKMDYLQVFEIESNESSLTLTNRQEELPFQIKIIIKNKVKGAKNTSIWVIDDLDYLTMLFPTDY